MGRKHFVSDQDGTLIKEAPYGKISTHYEFLEQNTEWVYQFQQGILTYTQAVGNFAEELGRRGGTKAEVVRLLTKLTPVLGLDKLLEHLNGSDSSGLALISGGLLEVSDIHGITPHFKEHHGARLTYDDDGRVTGVKHFEGTSAGKLSCVNDICIRHHITYRDVVYAGDSGNDHAVAKAIIQGGGTFLLVKTKETEGTIEHYYKRGERKEIEELKRIATATIQSLEEVIPFLE